MSFIDLQEGSSVRRSDRRRTDLMKIELLILYDSGIYNGSTNGKVLYCNPVAEMSRLCTERPEVTLGKECQLLTSYHKARATRVSKRR